jgi:acetyl-CoA carboxylase carboxyl transferase subunit beta
MASYASLGDVIIAEPGALIGFAGPRVIKETTREDIPPGFQRSDFMLRHGLVDAIIMRQDMKDTLIRLIGYMSRGKLPALPEQPNVKMTAPA